ncbi:MAG: hypothetical protein F4053_09580 [Proteobacteria bacterium]|nr:hypothetical protein [Pseudomonadota bacterium]
MLCLSTLAGPFACGEDPTGVTREPGFTADQAEGVIRFLAGRMPLYHTRLSEREHGRVAVPDEGGGLVLVLRGRQHHCASDVVGWHCAEEGRPLRGPGAGPPGGAGPTWAASARRSP